MVQIPLYRSPLDSLTTIRFVCCLTEESYPERMLASGDDLTLRAVRSCASDRQAGASSRILVVAKGDDSATPSTQYQITESCQWSALRRDKNLRNARPATRA
jgi:hypothetical protein